MLKTYYYLTKPGIIYGNSLSVIAGFVLGAKGFSWNLVPTVLGIGLIIACACILNNYIDRDIDKKMTRTKKRAFVTGKISVHNAMIFAWALGLGGFGLLLTYTNVLTATLGVIALVFYVIIYGIAKRRSIHGTLVGTIPGALPPVAGYTATTNQLDSAALLLFLILVFWQLPHFYAIAIYRIKDYSAAKIPVLPRIKGVGFTKLCIVLGIVAFTIACSLLSHLGHTGVLFLVVAAMAGAAWLYTALDTYNSDPDETWARKVFLRSLLVLLAICIAIPVDVLT